jgi:hypothetical protein
MNALTIESAIRLHLRQEGPCTLETLLNRLSQFSWSEIFSVVDQLSRKGSLVLRRPGRFGYELSIGADGMNVEAVPSGTAPASRPEEFSRVVEQADGCEMRG